MDLLQVQEELNIIIQIMSQQLELVESIQTEWNAEPIEVMSAPRSRASSIPTRPLSLPNHSARPPIRRSQKRFSPSYLSDPAQQLQDNLRREYMDLCELRDNANTLVNRTIQLVNIRLEDHGKAILVFTIVTIIFLPLSFVSSFFGMNTKDIRDMNHTQGLFWLISGCLTVGVVGFAIFLAFYGATIVEAFLMWKGRHDYPRKSTEQWSHRSLDDSSSSSSPHSFEVL